MSEEDDYLSEFNVIGKELREIEQMEAEYKETNDQQLLIFLARKINDLSELYVAADESYSIDYFIQKKKAADYYMKTWEVTNQPNSLLFSALFYLQSNERNKAIDCLKTIKKIKGDKEIMRFLDGVVLNLVDTLVNGTLRKAENMILSYEDRIDFLVMKEIKKTVEFLQWSKNKSEGRANDDGSKENKKKGGRSPLYRRFNKK